MTYLHFSIFLGHSKRHGGVKRSDQIASYLKPLAGLSLNPYLPLRDAFAFCLRHPLMFMRSGLFALGLFLFHGLSLIGLIKVSLQAAKLIQVIHSQHFDMLVMETAPGLSLHFMRYLAKRQIPYVALPHNVEYLVPHQHDKTFSNNGALFAAESFGYRHALKVFAICDFDRAVACCNGATASTLPYFPTDEEHGMFLDIRKNRRADSGRAAYLLLGTVENGPTYEGVKRFLDQHIESKSTMRVIVAGHGTEKFANYASSTVSVLGSVSNETLQELLATVSAILINQPQTSGFLTKIIEMNLCGVPQIILSDYQQSNGLEKFGVFQGMENAEDGGLRIDCFFDKPATAEFLAVLDESASV
jgi:hypothetical protein